MTDIDWIGFVSASVAVALAPGPGSLFVAKSAASGGVRAGRYAMSGIMAGDALLILLSLLGVSALFASYPSLFHTTRLMGACYLIFLGLQSLSAAPKNKAGDSQASALSFKKAFSITLLNPKAVLFFMAFFPVFIQSGEQGLLYSYAAMTLVFMVISASYLLFLCHVSSKVGASLYENSLLQSIVRKACGCLFIGFGVKVAISAR
jgi:threonine/homoserine/homoserine lactone efflux protein